MRPALKLSPTAPSGIRINVLIHKLEPQTHVAQMQHIVRKSQDPRERYEAALKYLSATYFQRSKEFSDHLSALFAVDSTLVNQILEVGRCVLDFEEKSKRYIIPCSVLELTNSDPQFQSTFWHNSMFNPTLPGHARVLSFIPDWTEARLVKDSGVDGS